MDYTHTHTPTDSVHTEWGRESERRTEFRICDICLESDQKVHALVTTLVSNLEPTLMNEHLPSPTPNNHF